MCTAHRYFRFKTLGSAAAGAGFEWCVRVRVRVRIRVSVRVRARVRVEVGASVSVRALVSSGASRGSNPATLYPCNPTSRRLQQPFACPGCNLGCSGCKPYAFRRERLFFTRMRRACYLVITPSRWERLLFTRVEFYGTLFSASTHKRSLRRRKE